MESTSVVFDDYIIDLIFELICLTVGFGRPMALSHRHNYKLDLAELDRKRSGLRLMVFGISCHVRKYNNPNLHHLYTVRFRVGRDSLWFHFDKKHRLVDVETSKGWKFEHWVTQCYVDDVFVRVRYQKDFANKPLALPVKPCGKYF